MIANGAATMTPNLSYRDDARLTDEEHRALVHLLRRSIDFDPYPYAPRLDPLKAVLVKLEPPEPLPPLKPGMVLRRGRGRWRR
jgi:hypothetical protein